MVLILSIKYSPHILALTIGWITNVFIHIFHIFINRGIERTTFIFYPFILPGQLPLPTRSPMARFVEGGACQ